jgi:hypothetical protein
MRWVVDRWPMILGLVGLITVTAKIFGMIPEDDDVAKGYAFVFVITIWWSYFLVASMITWLAAYWLELKSIWLLLIAPILVLFVSPKNSDLSSWQWCYNFAMFAVIAALPIFLGGSSQISRCNYFKQTLKIKTN